MTKQLKIGIIVGAIIIILTVWQRKDIMSMISGIVDTPPETLARQDGVTVEVESLARAMESEENSTIARTAIGLAIMNKARGSSITKLVTTAKDPKVNGKYSRQDVGPSKYCTTFKAPSRATLALAQDIYSGKVKDITQGAKQWDAPKAQDKLHAVNPTKYKSAAQVAENRISSGKRLVMIAGIPNTRFWA